MPKAAKKRHLQRDFQKIKQKVGKKKIVQNATKTEFRTRNIHMPSQSMGSTGSHEIVTTRKQALSDLIPRLQHHNISARRQGLEGIKELAEIASIDGTRSDSIKHQLGMVLSECCKLMTDTEGSVRSTLISLLSFLLSHYPHTSIQPHLPLVVIYICNGMTHLHKDIRSHSLEFLDLFTSHLPGLIAQFAADLVPNYLYLLKLASRTVNNTASSSDQSETKAKSSSNNLRLKIISSFLKFIKTIFKNEKENVADNISTNGVEIAWKFDGIDAPLRNGNRVPSDRLLASISTVTQKDNVTLPLHIILKQQEAVKESNQISNTIRDANGDWWHPLQTEPQISELASQLTPILIDYWMEALPTDFPNTSENLLMMQKILDIFAVIHDQCHSLTEGIRKGDMGCFTMLQRYIFTHFPFAERNIRLPGERIAIDLSEKFNYSVCYIAKRFIRAEEIESNWIQRILDFIISCFDSNKDNMQPLLDILERYFSLAMYNSETQEQQTAVWESFSDYFLQLPVLSPMKFSCLQFIQRIFQLKYSLKQCTEYETFIDDEIEQKWLSAFPRLLFKLKAKSLNAMKELTLDILLDYAVHIRYPKTQRFFDEIQVLMIPFFFASLPSGKQFYGPFSTTPSYLQRKVIHVIHYFSKWSVPLLNALVMCCKSPQRLSTDIVTQILESVYFRKESLSIPEFLSFLLNIVTAVGTNDDKWSEKRTLVANQQVAIVLDQVRLILSLLPYKANSVHIVCPSVLFLLEDGNLNLTQRDLLCKVLSYSVSCACSASEEDIFHFVSKDSTDYLSIMQHFNISI